MKVALIEFDDSPHDVNLYSQIRFLRSIPGTYISLIISEALRERIVYSDLVDDIHFVEKKMKLFGLLRLRSYLLAERFDKAIFNTAHGNLVRILVALPFPRVIEFIGISHYPDKFIGSSTQKLISRRVKKYFLLNDYLLQNHSYQPKLDIRSIYFIYYPELPKITVNKSKDDIWICIPGSVEFSRRDYLGLLKAIGNHELDKRIKFILLGNSIQRKEDGIILKEMITEVGLNDHFKLWDNFIGLEEFYSYINESDFIMPLIHFNHESFELYRNQISGAFNLAFGFRLTLLMDISFDQYDDFKDNSIFYKQENMFEIINNLKITDNQNKYKDDKWEFSYQANKYPGTN